MFLPAKTVKAAIFALLCCLLVSGCAQDYKFFLDDHTEVSLIRRIAVLPFANHTQTKLVEHRFRNVVTTEILSNGLFDVVESGDIQRFLDEELRKGVVELSTEMAKKMGRELDIDTYLVGAVDMYEEKRNGSYSYPVVALTMRLIEIKSNKIIWQASGSESGYGTLSRIFGFASKDFNQVSFRLAQKLMRTMY